MRIIYPPVNGYVYALFWICKAALPHLPPGATIINTTSIQAYDPSPNLLDYAPTKAAIVAFTKSLAKQVASIGIRRECCSSGTGLDTSTVQRRPAVGEDSRVRSENAFGATGSACRTCSHLCGFGFAGIQLCDR